jgi:hypothetical protein
MFAGGVQAAVNNAAPAAMVQGMNLLNRMLTAPPEIREKG